MVSQPPSFPFPSRSRRVADSVVGGSFVTTSSAPAIFRKSGLDTRTLSKIWDLADASKRGSLDEAEFYIAMHLLSSAMKGTELPLTIPKEVKANFQAMVSYNQTAARGFLSNSSF